MDYLYTIVSKHMARGYEWSLHTFRMIISNLTQVFPSFDKFIDKGLLGKTDTLKST